MLLHRRKEHGESEGRQPTTQKACSHTRSGDSEALPGTISMRQSCLRFPTNHNNVWTFGVFFLLEVLPMLRATPRVPCLPSMINVEMHVLWE